MTIHAPYPIGTPGTPWGAAEVAAWLSRQTRRRSYEADVLGMLEQKTKGNLDEAEGKLLASLIYDLRVAYVDAQPKKKA